MTKLQREHPEPGQRHNHLEDQAEICLAKVRNQMKDQATRTRNKPGQIFVQVVSHCDDDLLALLPSANSCKRTICNKRPTSPMPICAMRSGWSSIRFTRTVGPIPEQFLIYGDGPNINGHLLVFASKEGLRHLASVDFVYMDGNSPWHQRSSGNYLPCGSPSGPQHVTALLPNNALVTYEDLSQAVADKCAELDYELNLKSR